MRSEEITRAYSRSRRRLRFVIQNRRSWSAAEKGVVDNSNAFRRWEHGSCFCAFLGALWTVEHQRVCSVVDKTRQLIFLVVIDC